MLCQRNYLPRLSIFELSKPAKKPNLFWSYQLFVVMLGKSLKMTSLV